MTNPNTPENLPTSGKPTSPELATDIPAKFGTDFLHLPLALALDVAPLHERDLSEGGKEVLNERSAASALGRKPPSSEESAEPVKDSKEEGLCVGNGRLARCSLDTTAETSNESHIEGSAVQSVELSN
ncbi:hypothetical protein MKEN_00995900 [Mycena kentingensis (nom. inval.)]|nr:hypothetical protein MKEN_00995900 [Mycena kentingensis (nom. inval.)]